MSRDMSAVERKRALQAFANQANKRAKGRKVIATADEVPNTFMLRRPSGIMQLDIDTGGGLPAGGLSYISGPDNAGKTFLLWKYFAMQQRLFGNACVLGYAATESAPDFFFARKCGCRIAVPDEMIESKQQQRKEIGLPAFTKEELKEFKTQIGEVIIFRGGTAEELLDNVLAGVERNLFNILAVDSISSVLPSSEAQLDSVGDYGQQGAQATLVTKFMKKYCPLTVGLEGPNETTLIFTAQVRANRKKSELPSYMAKWEQEWATVGSWMGRHTKLIDITIWSGAFEKEKDTKTDKKVAVGKTLNWKLTKGKAGTHDGIVGETEIFYDRISNDIPSIIGPGIRFGVITERDGLISVPSNEKIKNIAGPERFVEKLMSDFDLEMDIRRRIISAAKIECIYR